MTHQCLIAPSCPAFPYGYSPPPPPAHISAHFSGVHITTHAYPHIHLGIYTRTYSPLHLHTSMPTPTFSVYIIFSQKFRTFFWLRRPHNFQPTPPPVFTHPQIHAHIVSHTIHKRTQPHTNRGRGPGSHGLHGGGALRRGRGRDGHG